MDLWFREIHAPRAWRVYLATGFDFREKIVHAFIGSIRARVWVMLDIPSQYMHYCLVLLCEVYYGIVEEIGIIVVFFVT